MRNNNDEHDNEVEPTLPAETSSEDPSTPTGKTTTSLTKEDEPSLPAESPSNIRTKRLIRRRWSWFHLRQPRDPRTMNPFRLESKRLDYHSKTK
jgi:hypothetical protein